jgi:coenzyme F420-dependent glucose-6-phosphate dehydrogenase
MTRFLLGLSHEQFPPEALLRQAVAGEEAGFDGITASDHLQPWWEGGESGHAWPWLGAVGASTRSVLLGTGVTPAGARYHPGLIAQAWMTLERLFGGRMYLGIGSGESLNETPVGDDWPTVENQVARMDEALDVIRRLWAGETVTQGGPFFKCKDLRLHTLAERRPPIWVSAFGPKAARVAAKWGDGVWTLADPENAPQVIEAYRAACDELGRAPGEIVLHSLVSYAPDDDAALEGARVWKGAQPMEFYKDEWHRPGEMYVEGERQLSDDDLLDKAVISSDPDVHAAKLQASLDMGATVVVTQNNSGADPLGMPRFYGEQVLPRLRSGAGGAARSARPA